MRPSSFLSLFIPLILLLLHGSLFIVNATVEETCKAVVAKNPSIRYDFCVNNFRRHPKSDGAQNLELAVIAATLSIDKADVARSNIEDLQKQQTDPATRSCLDQCWSLYQKMDFILAASMGEMTQGKVEDAKKNLSAAVHQPWDCEDVFSKAGKQSPVTQEAKDSVGLAAIALTILNLPAV